MLLLPIFFSFVPFMLFMMDMIKVNVKQNTHLDISCFDVWLLPYIICDDDAFVDFVTFSAFVTLDGFGINFGCRYWDCDCDCDCRLSIHLFCIDAFTMDGRLQSFGRFSTRFNWMPILLRYKFVWTSLFCRWICT